MNRKTLVSTFAVRIIMAISTFLLFVLSSRFLGAEGRGTISLFIANVTFVQLISEVIFGPGYIFFIHRYKEHHVIQYGFILSVASGLVLPCLFYAAGLHPKQLFTDLIINSILYSFMNWAGLHLRAHKKFKLYNIYYLFIALFQTALIWYLLSRNASVENYIIGMQIQMGISFIIGLVFIIFSRINLSHQKVKAPIRWGALFKKGISSQYSNWLNFLNTRISYYLIFLFFNNESLGIYSAACILTEAVWMIPYTLATPLYPILAAETNNRRKINLSKEYAYASFWLSLTAMFILVCIPETFFEYILGKDFKGLHSFILILSAGSFILSYARIHWNYFQASGMFHINTKASLYSFIIPLIIFTPLLPYTGLYGIAYMSCLSYLIYSFLLLYYYKTETDSSWKSILVPAFRIFPRL